MYLGVLALGLSQVRNEADLAFTVPVTSLDSGQRSGRGHVPLVRVSLWWHPAGDYGYLQHAGPQVDKYLLRGYLRVSL